MSILVVDDEPGLTYSLSLGLQKEGWGVVVAGSAPEALEHLDQDEDVEVLATDFNMPDMDGAQLVNRALAMKPELYTIVFTGWEDRNYAIRSLRVGADDFIDKEQDFGAKLTQAIRRGLHQVAIDRMGRQLLSANSEQQVLDLVSTTLTSFGWFGFCLAIRNSFGEPCRLVRAVSRLTGLDMGDSPSLAEDSAYRYVIETERLFFPPMLPEHQDLCPHLEDSQSIIIVPLFLHGSQRDALGLEHHDSDKFRIDDLRFLRQIADWLCLAMENVSNLERRSSVERKRAEEERGLLARSVLHEIKNPLNNIATAAQVVMERIADEELSHLLKNVDRLNRIVDSHLQPIAYRGEEPQQVALGEALDEAVSRFRIYNPKSGVRIQYETAPALPTITGRREMLVTAFVNLLQNGLAATGDRGHLSIRAHFVPLRGQVEILFGDDGPGISAGDLRRLFDYGYTTGGEGHFGYGLGLTQEVVELHGGEITAESGEGPGATFKVVLPLRRTGAMETGPGPTSEEV